MALPSGNYSIQALTGLYCRVTSAPSVVADAVEPERFQITNTSDGVFSIAASSGAFLASSPTGQVGLAAEAYPWNIFACSPAGFAIKSPQGFYLTAAANGFLSGGASVQEFRFGVMMAPAAGPKRPFVSDAILGVAARTFNFSAGPAMLPVSVLRQVQAELIDWRGSGMSVMDMSHRGPEFISIHADAESRLRALYAIPANYKVLFLQGGAFGAFSSIPMNFLRGKTTADYVETGEWSKKATAEAKKYCDVNLVASTAKDTPAFARAVPAAEWKTNPDAAYLHYCGNETVHGVQYDGVPDVKVPLVLDASSELLSKPVDISKFACVYGGAQKNCGPAGLTMAIVRDDMLGHVLPITPSVWDYGKQAAADSMLNTPPTFAIYVAGLVFKWVQDMGGLAEIQRRNAVKARTLYEFLDASPFYRAHVPAGAGRSVMNIPFFLNDPKFDAEFVKGANARGLTQLKGHRILGGMRASLYNAMPVEGVIALVEYMRDFAASHSS